MPPLLRPDRRLGCGLLLCLLLGTFAPLRAQVPLVPPDYTTTTKKAPSYYGPNAFPVPDVPDTLAARPVLDLSASFAVGYHGGYTVSTAPRLVLPLFTSRANITFWGTVVEGYHNSAATLAACRLANPTPGAIRGMEWGDLYVETAVLVFGESRRRPSLTFRSALKTASGGGSCKARFYDASGYWFDATVARTFPLSATPSGSVTLRTAVVVGFLCWDTGHNRQNDAPLYGLQATLHAPCLDLSTSWGGYVGWEHDGDAPMDVRARLTLFPHGRTPQRTAIGVAPFCACRVGLHDYDYLQLTAGVSLRF